MDKKIDFLLHIKLNSLKRDGLQSLTFKQLKRVVNETIWLLGKPKNVSQAAKDINALTINEVAKYLTVNDGDVQKSIEKLASAFENEEFDF